MQEEILSSKRNMFMRAGLSSEHIHVRLQFTSGAQIFNALRHPWLYSANVV